VRTALPRAGGLADQEAKLMDALDALLVVHTQLARVKAPASTPSRPPRGPRRG